MIAKRIALFVCDQPAPEVIALDGDYTVIFSEMLRKSLPDPSTKYTVDSFLVQEKMEYPARVDDYDAILLTGALASAYEDLEWINKLVSYVASIAEHKPKVKIIGICFGHQIISRAFGKACEANVAWEVGPTKLDLTEEGRRVFGVDTMNTLSMHRDHIPEVPASCHLLASSSICHNQGFVRFCPTHHPHWQTRPCLWMTSRYSACKDTPSSRPVLSTLSSGSILHRACLVPISCRAYGKEWNGETTVFLSLRRRSGASWASTPPRGLGRFEPLADADEVGEKSGP